MKHFSILLLLLLAVGARSQELQPSQQVLQEIYNNMVYVEGGSFMMGCTSEQIGCYEDERPAHQVSISDFMISKYEVTQSQWEAVMETSIWQQRDSTKQRWPLFGAGFDYPMYYVSWIEAQEFITRLNQFTEKNYRLPTEAEWEYAARGGTKSEGYRYAGSNIVEEVAWVEHNSINTTNPVGQKNPNELGLYDMSGNVWEWCSDWFEEYRSYSDSDPTGPYSGMLRVLRGGSWANDARYSRLPTRGNDTPDRRDYCFGFRLVLSYSE